MDRSDATPKTMKNVPMDEVLVPPIPYIYGEVNKMRNRYKDDVMCFIKQKCH